MFALIITGGTVIDEMGSPGSPTNIGVTGERIAAVGDLQSSEGRSVIDALGLVVSPGFIDTHAHSDASLLEWIRSRPPAFDRALPRRF